MTRPKHVRRRPVDPMAAGLTLAIILGGTLGVVAGARSVTQPEPSRALRAAPPTTIAGPAVRDAGTRTPPPAIPPAGPRPGPGRTVPTVRRGGPRAGAVPPAAADPTTTTAPATTMPAGSTTTAPATTAGATTTSTTTGTDTTTTTAGPGRRHRQAPTTIEAGP